MTDENVTQDPIDDISDELEATHQMDAATAEVNEETTVLATAVAAEAAVADAAIDGSSSHSVTFHVGESSSLLSGVIHSPEGVVLRKSPHGDYFAAIREDGTVVSDQRGAERRFDTAEEAAEALDM